MKRILSLLCAVLLSVPAQMQASQPSNATMGGIAALGLGFGYFGYGAYRTMQTRNKIKDLKQLQGNKKLIDKARVPNSDTKLLPIFDSIEGMRKKYGLPTVYRSSNKQVKDSDLQVSMARINIEGIDKLAIASDPSTFLAQARMETENKAVFYGVRNQIPEVPKVVSDNIGDQKLDRYDRREKLKMWGLAGASALCLGGAAVVGWFGWKK